MSLRSDFLRFLKPLVVLSAAAAAPGALGADPQVDIKTNMGTIRLELYPAKAPKTVENFLQYVKDGHYSGTVFHRVIDGFMIQGGGFDGAFRQKATRPSIQNEAKNGLKNDLGTIAMARTSEPHSASAQFFINLKNNDFLNAAAAQDGWGYAVFGKVVSGLDLVTKIGKMPTGAGGPFRTDVPREAVVIESMTVVAPKK
jgi:peptidyl-prolyl cis-trans isomerase A (cyclophilin A)/peptidyl-prolyl cis-trans isomerase B (cyclophilin B)